jgi:hypothetical protein
VALGVSATAILDAMHDVHVGDLGGALLYGTGALALFGLSFLAESINVPRNR